LFLACGLLSCLGGPVSRGTAAKLETDPEAALAELEPLARRHPGDVEVQLALGIAHYRLARKSLDGRDEPAYLRHLEKATLAFVATAELSPGSASPHIYLAMVAAYRADMQGALRSLQKARQLAPNHPISYTNLAQVYIYLGELNRARAMLDRARKLGGPGPYVEINEMLEAWKRGDMVDARDLFDGVYATSPESLQTWDEAPVPEPIESFDDFVAYCCGNPSCGPYMRGPCERARQEVAEREVTLETLRREKQIAIEARERLGKVYPGERELEIEVEDPGAPEKPKP
jgi:tetratricopeptide (TPR) repeat protein